MKRNLVTAVSAAVLSLSLLAGPALSQVQLAAEVLEKLTMLGFDMTDVVVTEEQVLELENVLNSTDEDDAKKMQIEEILAE